MYQLSIPCISELYASKLRVNQKLPEHHKSLVWAKKETQCANNLSTSSKTVATVIKINKVTSGQKIFLFLIGGGNKGKR